MQKLLRSVSRTAAAFLLSNTLIPWCQAQIWNKSVTVEIRAPDHKPDGKTWDLEIPVLFGALMPTMGDPAPDMMLCVVDTAGHENCIHDSRLNPAGVPLSICPNAYVCTFSNVKVPGTGYFGLLIVDLDPLPSKQDYMLAAIMRNGGQEDPSQAWKIEKNIKGLIAQWHVYGGPDEYQQADVADCSIKNPCFGDSRGGIPSLAIGELAVGVCGMPMTGVLDFGPGYGAGSVTFTCRMTANECPGHSEYTWNFGDGTKVTTTVPQASHIYNGAGSFAVTVTPRCIRISSACDAKPVSTRVTIGH